VLTLAVVVVFPEVHAAPVKNSAAMSVVTWGLLDARASGRAREDPARRRARSGETTGPTPLVPRR